MAKSMQPQGPFGDGVNRICAVAAASTAKELVGLIRSGLRETRTIEIRLDWLRNDAERGRILDWVRRHKPKGSTFLVTCRTVTGGGKLRGGVQAELFWLVRAREAGCEWCDLEVETLRRLPDKSVREYAVPPRVLLSEHDFRGMPRLPECISPPAEGEADAVKIAAHARTISDSLRLLRLAKHSRNCVVVPMGEVGLPARILALREGSALAYAPIAAATAPGQVSLHDLKHLYRADQLTRKTAVYGVIGNPIGHSLSPHLHNAGFIARFIDAVFLPFLVHNLGDFVSAIPEIGIRGFSVTLPHKRGILKFLDACEPFAAQMESVNTVVVRRNGSLFGCNTDYLGVIAALEHKLRIAGSRILIVGAGGSASSAAFALARAGASIFICARREAAARSLARAAGGEAIRRSSLRTEGFDAILNATPVGMYPKDDVSPLTASELNCRLVMDFVYSPLRTKLLQIAAKKRIATVSGLEMFLAQGFAQWELWTGRRPPEKLMRRAVLEKLRARERSR